MLPLEVGDSEGEEEEDTVPDLDAVLEDVTEDVGVLLSVGDSVPVADLVAVVVTVVDCVTLVVMVGVTGPEFEAEGDGVGVTVAREVLVKVAVPDPV